MNRALPSHADVTAAIATLDKLAFFLSGLGQLVDWGEGEYSVPNSILDVTPMLSAQGREALDVLRAAHPDPDDEA